VKKYLIIFDFDGVIADSFAAAVLANKRICPRMTPDDYRRRFEENINDWEAAGYGCSEECQHDIDFFDEYIPLMKTQVVVFPGIADVIKELAGSYQLAIISSTLSEPISEFIERNELASFFPDILGNDVHQDKAEKMQMLFAKYGNQPVECVLITDTLGDMKEAARAGVGVIAAAWGFSRKDALLRGRPFRLVEQPAELLGAIADYFRR